MMRVFFDVRWGGRLQLGIRLVGATIVRVLSKATGCLALLATRWISTCGTL